MGIKDEDKKKINKIYGRIIKVVDLVKTRKYITNSVLRKKKNEKDIEHKTNIMYVLCICVILSTELCIQYMCL